MHLAVNAVVNLNEDPMYLAAKWQMDAMGSTSNEFWDAYFVDAQHQSALPSRHTPTAERINHATYWAYIVSALEREEVERETQKVSAEERKDFREYHS